MTKPSISCKYVLITYIEPTGIITPPTRMSNVAMESVNPKVPYRNQHLETKKVEINLRVVCALTEAGFSSHPFTLVGIISPKQEGEMGMTAYRFVRPNSQATAQKHNGCPICLGINTLTRYDSEGAD